MYQTIAKENPPFVRPTACNTCQGTSKNGNPCGIKAVPSGKYCRYHSRAKATVTTPVSPAAVTTVAGRRQRQKSIKPSSANDDDGFQQVPGDYRSGQSKLQKDTNAVLIGNTYSTLASTQKPVAASRPRRNKKKANGPIVRTPITVVAHRTATGVEDQPAACIEAATRVGKRRRVPTSKAAGLQLLESAEDKEVFDDGEVSDYCGTDDRVYTNGRRKKQDRRPTKQEQQQKKKQEQQQQKEKPKAVGSVDNTIASTLKSHRGKKRKEPTKADDSTDPAPNRSNSPRDVDMVSH
jgi:hypothetical protein